MRATGFPNLGAMCLVLSVLPGTLLGQYDVGPRIRTALVEAMDSVVYEAPTCGSRCSDLRVVVTAEGKILRSRRVSTGSVSQMDSTAMTNVGEFRSALRLGQFRRLPDAIRGSALCGPTASHTTQSVITVFAHDFTKRVVDDHGCWWRPILLEQLTAMLEGWAHFR